MSQEDLMQPVEAAPPDTGGLSTSQLVFLCVSSGIPAIGLSSFALLLVGVSGWSSWLTAMCVAAVGFALGRVVVVFARRYVVSGSLASYVAEVFGDRARSFVAGSLLLGYVGQLIAIQVLASMFATSYLISIGVDQAAEASGLVIIFVVTGVVPALIAWRGLDESVRIAVLFTLVSVPLILFISGASAVHTGLQLDRQLSLEGFTWSGFAVGAAASAAWLVSFESGTTLAAETKDPQKSLPAAVFAIPTVVVVYFIATILQVPGLMQVGDKLAAGMSLPSALAVNAGLDASIGQICDLLLCVGVFAALVGFANYVSRIVVAYAEDGMLPAFFARRDPNRGTPAIAILTAMGVSTAALMAVVVINADSLLTVYAAIATLVVFFWIAPYVLTCAAAVVLMVRESNVRASVLLCAVVGAAGMAYPWINSFIEPPASPIDAMSYVAIVAVGLLGIALLLRLRRSHAPSRTEPTHAQQR